MTINAKVFRVGSAELEATINSQFEAGYCLTPMFPIFQEDHGNGKYEYVLIMLPLPTQAQPPAEERLVEAARPGLLVPSS